MPTHHAAHHEHTMNVIVVLVWLCICICIRINIFIYIFQALAERAGRAAAASTQPTLSQIHLCRKHFFFSVFFRSHKQLIFLVFALDISVVVECIVYIVLFLGRTFFVQCRLPCFDFCCNLKDIFHFFSCSQATNLMIFKFIFLFSLFNFSWL